MAIDARTRIQRCDWRPGRHRAAAALAALGAVLGCFALTASYTDETAFIDIDHVKAGIFPYLGANGPTAGMLLCLTVLTLEYCGFVVFGRWRNGNAAGGDEEREDGGHGRAARGWSVTMGLVLALTLTIPPHSVTHEATSQLASAGAPPAVASEYQTVWYWLYYGLRYAGFALLLTAVAALALRGALRMAGRVAAGPAAATATTASGDEAGHEGHGIWRQRCRRLFGELSAAHALTIGAIIFVCWLPWTILVWPANIAADTVAQLVWMRTGQAWDPSTHDYLPDYALSDQHPWLDSLIYGAFDQLGLWMGSEAWGLWLLAFLQTVLCALALGLVLNYLGGVMRLGWRFCAGATAFMALVPIYGRLMMSVVKDSTVMPFFLVLMVLVMEYIRRVRAGVRLGPWLVIGLIVLSVLCAQMRKISTEILLGTFIILAVVLAKRRLTSLAVAVAPVVIGMIISAVAMPALHVAPGGKQEMIAIPLQQTSAFMVAHPDRFSASDHATFDRVIACSTADLDNYLTWNPWDGKEIGGADAIKDRCFNRDATSGDILSFLGLWARLSAGDPITALAATPWLRDPFVMGPVYDEGWYVRWGWEEMGSNMIMPEYKSTWTAADVSEPQKIGAPLYELFEGLPGVSLLMRENLYTVWVPLFAMACCFVIGGRRWRNLVYLTPWLLTIGSLLVLPGHQTRYTWTLTFGVAMIIAVPWIREEAAGAGAGSGSDSGSDTPQD
ncbi:DUF6020 family protein [Bifidobacterium avesanii]|uniref:Uncharacterized protein n=1 Tax=Bifidobacterium avesanii TaxID=1798157 RepID=A0A7K3TJW6_9BIFI|nr:DUF6020 family protein [Bifidobacterium avesanii]KAB8290098.1 hypothetical protein DSM100685_1502 [Bifidobacterium avesanii]NEG78954.1 hypothetical protein [Bifidobacterium avesanii]